MEGIINSVNSINIITIIHRYYTLDIFILVSYYYYIILYYIILNYDAIFLSFFPYGFSNIINIQIYTDITI